MAGLRKHNNLTSTTTITTITMAIMVTVLQQERKKQEEAKLGKVSLLNFFKVADATPPDSKVGHESHGWRGTAIPRLLSLLPSSRSLARCCVYRRNQLLYLILKNHRQAYLSAIDPSYDYLVVVVAY